MNINIIAIGTKMPDWVQTGYNEYAKRLTNYCKLQLIELPLAKRNKNTSTIETKRIESKSILDKISKQDYVIALDLTGKQYSTEKLAKYLNNLAIKNHVNISILIGGPDGLSKDCLKRANDTISLSELTLPHPLVRILLSEQLYRAFSLLSNHPYHK